MKESSKTQIILGLLTLTGVIVAALIYNFDKFTQDHASTEKNGPQIIGQGNTQIIGSGNVINGIDNNTKEKVEDISNKATSLENKTDILLERSERSPQITMTEFVKFYSDTKVWNAPNIIYPGSIIELHGFSCALEVKTNSGFRAKVNGAGWDQSSEIVVIGHSGEGTKWRIEANSDCEGKVFVFSSPRIRSIERSWSEEARIQ